jgi:hypothetical protein
MTKRTSLGADATGKHSAEYRSWLAMKERWQPAETQPKPAKTREELMDERAAADFAQMTAANARPIPPGMLAAEPWTGGGFSWNGVDVVVRRRVVRRRKRK